MQQTTPAAKDRRFSYEALALFIAVIWGSTFIAQKTAMDTTGPWLFSSVRFLVAVPPLLLMVLLFERQYLLQHWRKVLIYGAVPGLILATSAILQQVALLWSYASKASLITTLYVCILPFISVFIGFRLQLRELAAACLALSGLYFLSVSGGWTMAWGDFLLVISAFGWALHIISLELCLRQIKPFTLAFSQTTICALVLSGGALVMDLQSITALTNDFNRLVSEVWFEVLYSGVVSVGLAFGLQVLCQQHLSPNRVGLIFSTESLFGVLFAWLFLSELLTQREWFGAMLMLLALVVVRLELKKPA